LKFRGAGIFIIFFFSPKCSDEKFVAAILSQCIMWTTLAQGKKDLPAKTDSLAGLMDGRQAATGRSARESAPEIWI
jgi:hypothetical protein